MDNDRNAAQGAKGLKTLHRSTKGTGFPTSWDNQIRSLSKEAKNWWIKRDVKIVAINVTKAVGMEPRLPYRVINPKIRI
jgi:hypothetical protein